MWQTIDVIVADYRQRYPGLTNFEYLTLAHQLQLVQVIGAAHGFGGLNNRPHLSHIYEKLEEIRRQNEQIINKK